MKQPSNECRSVKHCEDSYKYLDLETQLVDDIITQTNMFRVDVASHLKTF